jgi:hypothetical protein
MYMKAFHPGSLQKGSYGYQGGQAIAGYFASFGFVGLPWLLLIRASLMRPIDLISFIQEPMRNCDTKNVDSSESPPGKFHECEMEPGIDSSGLVTMMPQSPYKF